MCTCQIAKHPKRQQRERWFQRAPAARSSNGSLLWERTPSTILCQHLPWQSSWQNKRDPGKTPAQRFCSAVAALITSSPRVARIRSPPASPQGGKARRLRARHNGPRTLRSTALPHAQQREQACGTHSGGEGVPGHVLRLPLAQHLMHLVPRSLHGPDALQRQVRD